MVFLDEFTVFAAEIMVKYNNIIILGNINPHINDTDDPDPHMFLDTINAMDLKQHDKFPTHRGENNLDVIMTASHTKIKTVNVIQGPYISDNCIIKSRIKIDSTKITKTVTCHKRS